ncbi:DUF952 domain-containing protein [Phenylobacterium deserti]|uniref:DUF952 domain-containing protein n=1 Tax=Phenylobacterium deserti TaxID=1914756 RepID=A0A328AS24_9CAUL|nr:DUF952 domain-containing protein [Phenylobacterium deserti]RAK57853.1 DUF952 domain-containing protein [Phenylobacterium deserti]
MSRIYKILPRSEWTAAQAAGAFNGSAIDLADGFIHFSTGSQAGETARRHFAGVGDLIVLEVEGDRLGETLRWEPSRGGDLFPHLYGPLLTSDVCGVTEAPLGPDGVPQIGDLA